MRMCCRVVWTLDHNLRKYYMDKSPYSREKDERYTCIKLKVWKSVEKVRRASRQKKDYIISVIDVAIGPGLHTDYNYF